MRGVPRDILQCKGSELSLSFRTQKVDYLTRLIDAFSMGSDRNLRKRSLLIVSFQDGILVPTDRHSTA